MKYFRMLRRSAAKSTFCGVETKCVFKHTCGSAPKSLSNLDGKLERFDTKKVGKAVCQIKVRPTDYRTRIYFHCLDILLLR